MLSQMSVAPAGQAHCPLVQVPPVGQSRPQVRQFSWSFDRFAHPLGHCTWFAPQVQIPAAHVPPVHECRHWPQFPWSVWRFTHALLQLSGVPAGQAHCPLVQVPPAGQSRPQFPQFCGSFDRFAHPSGHATSLAPQVQIPAAHVPPVQECPQLPQAARLV